MQNITDVVTLLTNEYAKLNGDLTDLLSSGDPARIAWAVLSSGQDYRAVPDAITA